jgi:hypothetical protein
MKALKLPVSFVALLAVAGAYSSASAAISLYAEYHLGEAGSLGSNNLPQDSSGNGRNMLDPINGSSATVGTLGVYAHGSTAYLNTSGTGSEGWYSSNLVSGLQTDNFAFGVFARASSLSGTQGDIFTVGGSDGSLKISLAPNGWAASAHNITWIGGDNGVSGSFTSDMWVHLAMIRSGGVTTLYINGVAQGSTYSGTPVNNTPHVSVSPGGLTYFDGLIDEARIVTFTAGEPSNRVINALQGVPEPSTSLLGAAAAGLLFRRRRLS